jgi:predicted RNA-binding protein
MSISISFLTNFNSICGIFDIKMNDVLSKQNIESMFTIIQTQFVSHYKETGKIKAKDILGSLEENFGEVCNISLDLNLQFYGEENIGDMLSEIDGENKVIFFMDHDNKNFVDFNEEGSQNKIEEMLEAKGFL